jgi:arabinofuranosyltransferase
MTQAIRLPGEGEIAPPVESDAEPDAGPAAAGSPRDPLNKRQPASSALRWWPVVVPVVVVLVGAWLYRWVDEDAFINFRIIDNLLAGHGLVFNVGERVEVDSDPLWLFTLTALHEILPFVAIEWLSVFLGLVCTGAGFLTGGRAIQRLAFSRNESTVFPLGLLIGSVVAGVWEFATSGLEMSMVFLWLGASFLLLVRVETRRNRAVPTAIVMGLGPLIRPELALCSVVFVVVLLLVVAAPGWSGARRRLVRYGVPLAASLALPVAFQIFRMGYYALLVPNTGLAKAGGAAWWSQGFTYLWNFVAPYTLWLPLILALPFVLLPAARWWKRGDRMGVVVLATPIVAALADILYVVHVGGDYMHARLLLPGFFALCLPIFVSLRQARSILIIPLIGIVAWAVVCAGWLRFVPPKVTSLNPQTVFISNERNSWISATDNAHPVTATDYRKALSGSAGALLNRLARPVPDGHQHLLIITNPYAPIDQSGLRPAHSDLPFTLAVNVPAIGVIGYLAGPNVYIFDSYSLANPIGSHTVIVKHARPGHEKYIGPAWLEARFGTPALDTLPIAGGPTPQAVAAARRALGCDPLAAYLHAITAPMTVSRFASDFGDAFRYTSMSFSANPTLAATELCGSQGRGTSATNR